MHPIVARNRTYWDHLVSLHVSSEYYDVKGLIAGSKDIDPVVLDALGNVNGKRVLHLQCHFGADTLALARRGAIVTGLDFSPKAIEVAHNLAQKMGLPARFVEDDVMSAELGNSFDIVFSSWGAIGWLPELTSWAATIARHLEPGGRFVLVDGHPILWMMGETLPAQVKYAYAVGEPIVEEAKKGTYAAPNAPVPHASYGWNHSLAEVMGALCAQGLRLVHFAEGDRIPWEAWPGMTKAGQYWRLPDAVVPFPLSMTIVFERPIPGT